MTILQFQIILSELSFLYSNSQTKQIHKYVIKP